MDEALFKAINGLAGQSAWLDSLLLALGHWSSLLIPGAVLFAYWVWVKRWEAAVAGAAGLTVLVVLSDFVGAQVKHLVGRARPCRVFEHVNQIAGCGGTFSFPSNHAMNTAAAAAFVQVLYPATGWISWPLVALIGFSRVYVGAHFVTDVLGAWVMGGIIGAGAGLIVARSRYFKAVPKRAARRAGGEA
jgi:undecaprenyl-diphosphatase